MHDKAGARAVWARALAVCGALCLLMAGCGSNVIVAEQTQHNQVAADGGEQEPADSTHVTLCGAARCKDLSVDINGTGTVTGYACCVDPARSACGVVEVTQCVELNYPGHVNAACPSLPLSGSDAPGCCRPDGTCGVLDTQYGLGCAQLPFVPSSLAGTCVY